MIIPIHFVFQGILDELQLKLTGPFDILNGNIKKDTKLPKEKLNLHGRYFVDSPEVSTVLCSTQNDNLHIAYFRWVNHFCFTIIITITKASLGLNIIRIEEKNYYIFTRMKILLMNQMNQPQVFLTNLKLQVVIWYKVNVVNFTPCCFQPSINLTENWRMNKWDSDDQLSLSKSTWL